MSHRQMSIQAVNMHGPLPHQQRGSRSGGITRGKLACCLQESGDVGEHALREGRVQGLAEAEQARTIPSELDWSQASITLVQIPSYSDALPEQMIRTSVLGQRREAG